MPEQNLVARTEVPPMPSPSALRVRQRRLDDADPEAPEPTDPGRSPSARLRLVIRRGDVGGVDAADEAAFEGWLSTELHGCRLERGTGSHVIEHGQSVGTACMIAKDIGSIWSILRSDEVTTGADAMMPGGSAVRDAARAAGAATLDAVREALIDALDPRADTSAALQAFRSDLIEVVGAAAGETTAGVGGAVADVLERIPGIGLLASGLFAIRSSVYLVDSALNRPTYARMTHSSISVIEREALWSADHYETRRQIQHGIKVTTSLANSAAHGLAFVGVPAAPVVGAITKIIELTHRVTTYVIDVVMVRQANQWLEAGEFSAAHLRQAPPIGLTLPHLPGASSLQVLGIVPPGWRAEANDEQADLLRRAFVHPDNFPLVEALRQDAPPSPQLGGAAVRIAHAVIQNPWRFEQERLVVLHRETHKHAYDVAWKLVRNGQPVFDPAPQELEQKVKAAALAAWQRLKSVAGEIGLDIASSTVGKAVATAARAVGAGIGSLIDKVKGPPASGDGGVESGSADPQPTTTPESGEADEQSPRIETPTAIPPGSRHQQVQLVDVSDAEDDV